MQDTAFDLDSRAASCVPISHPLVAAVLRARRSIGLPATAADGSTDSNAHSPPA